VEALERFAQALDLPPVCLVTHDWGGLIGLRWACDNRGRVRALVLSDTGFFSDGKWHGMADTLRAPGEGERLMESWTPELLGQGLGAMSRGIGADSVTEYSKLLADPIRRAGALELYRSGDFEKLEPYAGCLAALDVPALCLWGENDSFAPIAGAYRFAKEIEDCEVVAVPDTGHFVYEDDPEACAAAVTRFLGRLAATA
jgi:haloalkane dehalogenase